MTTEKRIMNERHFLEMMRFTQMYMWINECEIFYFKNNKIFPQTRNGYFQLSRVVRPQFMKLFVEKQIE